MKPFNQWIHNQDLGAYDVELDDGLQSAGLTSRCQPSVGGNEPVFGVQDLEASNFDVRKCTEFGDVSTDFSDVKVW